jgi:hypothetical protein
MPGNHGQDQALFGLGPDNEAEDFGVTTALGGGDDLLDRLVNVAGTPTWTKHVIRKTADETATSDTTLSDDTHLTTTLGVDEVYFFLLWLKVDSNSTADFKLDWTRPAGTTMQWGSFGTAGVSAFDRANVGSLPATLTKETGSDTFGTTNGSGFFVGQLFAGWITVGSTAGTFALRWAQNTSDGAGTTLKKDSSLMLWRLA